MCRAHRVLLSAADSPARHHCGDMATDVWYGSDSLMINYMTETYMKKHTADIYQMVTHDASFFIFYLHILKSHLTPLHGVIVYLFFWKLFTATWCHIS